jgi:hypothetical protein
MDVDTMYKAIVASGLAAILAGCVTAERVPLPSGRQGYTVENCDSLSACYKKAAEVCGGPYDIVSQAGEPITTAASAGRISAPKYAMAIECKSSR